MPDRSSPPPKRPDTAEVAELFDEKAAGWGTKYEPGGALRGRLTAFERRLARRTPPPARLVELGCGAGDLAAHLANLGYALDAFDISPRMLDEARRRHGDRGIAWHALAADWTRLPLEDASADAVVASSVFEYLPDPVRVAVECARVLKPGGVLLFTAPNPRAGIRRVEALVRPIVTRLPALPLPARVGRHLTYLRVSQQRHTPQGWAAYLSAAALSPASDGAVDEAAMGGPRAPLMLLAFERPSRTGPARQG